MHGYNYFPGIQAVDGLCKNSKTYQPIDYRVADDTIVQPDMLVVCGEITKKYLDFPPALVAEILSPVTALKNRHSKFSIYEKQGIAYYIIISPETEEAEIYQLGRLLYPGNKRQKLFLQLYFWLMRADINFGEIW